MSSTKYRYMAQCVESLRHLVHEKIELLKKNKYLANADWLFIENNFRIDNPHAPSAVGDRAESELSESQRADLHEEARVRVLNIQKVNEKARKRNTFVCYDFRQAFGDSIEITKSRHKQSVFSRRCATMPWTGKAGALVSINSRTITSERLC